MRIETAIDNGMRVRDRVTGFEGVVTGIVIYISGCHQALVHPGMGKDGKLLEGSWFDLQRLEQVGKEIINLDNTKTPGCDAAPPQR